MSDAEERRLLDVFQGRRKHLRSIVLIDLQTGLRKQELLSLRWQNVDFERDVIHVMNSRRERTKSGRSRPVPLTSIAREELLALQESGWSEYVFVNSKTLKPLTDVKKAFTSALRKAGIEDFHFHDLRHTCATRLGDRGASAFEIAEIMGWSDIRMATQYTHATRGLNRNYNRRLKKIFMSAALVGIVRRPFQPYYQRLLAQGLRPELARLTLARKIAAITLAVWKKGERFDPEKAPSGPYSSVRPGPGSAMSDSLHSFICFALTNDFVNDARDRCGGVD